MDICSYHADTQGSNPDFPPPPSAASQDNLLADATAVTNDPGNQHRHEGSMGEAGSVALDVLNRAASPVTSAQQAPDGTTPQPGRGMSPSLTHARHGKLNYQNVKNSIYTIMLDDVSIYK